MDSKQALERILVFDGAMGTMLMEKGLQAGVCPEIINVKSPEKVLEVHKAYIHAGADVISTNSFGGNRIKLSQYLAADRVREVNLKAVEIARKAAEGTKVYVAASVGPMGRFVEPAGDMTFTAAYDVFGEQIQALACGKPDFILLETFSDLGEIRAALLAARDVCDIPVICCLTYDGGRTLTGVNPASAAVVLESMGAAAVGANCSGGPGELYGSVMEMQKNTGLPVIVQPNAGIPSLRDGKTFYPLKPVDFAKAMEPYLDKGINLLGSCCGSTPEHTRLLSEKAAGLNAVAAKADTAGVLASSQRVIRVRSETLPLIIGERINPTARKSIAESLRNGDSQAIREEAENQVGNGACLLDINIGTPGIDEADTMYRLVNMLQRSIDAPLVIDSTNPAVIEKGLQAYHGKALVNSVSGEQESLDKILPLVKRYGAAVVGLTLDGKGIPATAEERLKIAGKIAGECTRHGIPAKDIYIDALVLAVGIDSMAAVETLRAIKMVKERLGTNTVLGISNVSHGLPGRSKVNAAFLAMAIASGLDAAIVNPSDSSISGAWQAASLLAGRDPNAGNFLKHNTAKAVAGDVGEKEEEQAEADAVKQMVVRGFENIEAVVEKLLGQGIDAGEIIDRGLIPGLNIVGELFAKGEYYLPQLMLSAETAQKAFGILEKRLGKRGSIPDKGTVVIGTVKGDVHDIGKNMVAVMLRNHGYRVLDLGKGVSAERFAEAALQEGAEFAALSALMTTTMVEIPGTIRLLKKKLPDIKIIVGGAVVTGEFAREAGADGYGRDAVDAVRTIENLRGK